MDFVRLGFRIRKFRQQAGLTQAEMARRLGISASYLNLIEHGQRKVSANLLLKLAGQFDVDVKSFGSSETAAIYSELMEVFSDPVFDEHNLMEQDVRDFVGFSPELARAVIHLFQLFDSERQSSLALAVKVKDNQDGFGMEKAELFSEQVSDLIQRNQNYFPPLEEGAERLRKEAELDPFDLYRGLAAYLISRHGIRVQTVTIDKMNGAVRRFDSNSRELLLSEGLNMESRSFQLAHQIALLNYPDILDRYASDSQLTSEASKRLCRVALASYFAGALLMPYEAFLKAAVKERYDIDVLCHRFRCSFEQVCHRLTSLKRKGAEGVPFSLVRIDIAGNISKKFSTGDFHFPRFSGLCPLRNVHLAFLQPGQIRVQLSRLPDGMTYFSIARTIKKFHGGYHTPQVRYAIGLGCDVQSAKQLIYSDGMDLSQTAAAVPVGVTCRLCPRMDCESRAFPSIQQPLEVDEDKRGLSFYAPVQD